MLRSLKGRLPIDLLKPVLATTGVFGKYLTHSGPFSVVPIVDITSVEACLLIITSLNLNLPMINNDMNDYEYNS